MATPVKNFLNLLLPYVPGAPDIAAMNALRRTAIEFCSRTMVWRTMQTADMVAATSAYTVASDTDANVNKVLAVSVSGLWLEPIQVDEMTRIDNWNTQTAATPSRYYLTQPGVVNLWPIPTASVTGGLLFQTVEQPSIMCSTVPDFLYNQYGQAMIDGALAVLLSTPAQQWTNPDLAVWHRQQFENQIGVTMQVSSEGFGRTPVRARAVQ